MQEITIRINRDGSEVTIAVNGVKGASCESLTDALTKSFGEVSWHKRTPEYYQEEVGVISNQV